MHSLGTTIAKLARQRRQWERLWKAIPGGQAARGLEPPVSRLTEVADFGSNPGNLRMFEYVPERLAASPALVVVLHGCTPDARPATISAPAGRRWRTATASACCSRSSRPPTIRSAASTGFSPATPNAGSRRGAVDPADDRRDGATHGIDRRRVFVTGLSAGGAMTAVMLATYPEVFAAGAIIAGLPYRRATNVQQAFDGMFQGAAAAGARVGRSGARRFAASRTVAARLGLARRRRCHGKPSNAGEIIKQWTDVHGLAAAAEPQRRWSTAIPGRSGATLAGEDVIESYTITSMAHGTPLATGAADDRLRRGRRRSCSRSGFRRPITSRSSSA